MQRSKAPIETKWDLTHIYSSETAYNKDFTRLKSIAIKMMDYKGKLNTKESIKEYFDLASNYSMIIDKLATYVYLNHDVDLQNTHYTDMLKKLDDFSNDVSVKTAFVAPELALLTNEFLLQLKNDEDFKNYTFSLDSIMRNKKHTLSESEEKALATAEYAFGAGSDIYESLFETDITYGKAGSGEHMYDLTNENFVSLLTNKDRDVRKNVFKAYYEKLKQFSLSFANCLVSDIKESSYDLKLRGYTSLLEAQLKSEEMPFSVYKKLINKVNDNLPILHNYYGVNKKALNLHDFSYYDMYLPIISEYNLKLNYNQQLNIVKKALSVFGDDYVNRIVEMANNRYIDVYSQPNQKAGGGYCSNVYGVKYPYILLNDNNNYNSLSTLAHELGHAMHDSYANENQPFEKVQASLYVAEVASTVNELLLNLYLFKNAKTLEEKIYLLDNRIKNFKATVYRQTMFSEFEQQMHTLVENKKPINRDIIVNLYSEINKKYAGSNVTHNDLIGYEWIRISHFYRPYYVHTYSTSYITAYYIANNIFSGNEKLKHEYIQMLKKGGSEYPYNLLASMGVDLATNKPYDYAFNCLQKDVEILCDLIKQRRREENAK